MTHVAVASMFRDSQTWHGRPINQVDRFFRQFRDQQGRNDAFRLTFHLVEGDSKDDTHAAVARELAAWADREGAPAGELLKFDNGGPAVASLESAARFANLSRVANVAFRAARDSGADYVLWVESDLILDEHAVASLLGCFPVNEHARMVAPLPVFLQNGREAFYDTWAFEGAAGEKWGNHDLHRLREGGRYRRMNSVGCCALVDGPTLRAGSIDFGAGCFPALCSSVRAAGGEVLCDRQTVILHPSNQNVAGRLI